MANEIWVPVENYGAIGDGVTNDQSAIQTAINSGNLVCLSSNKTYLINSSLEIGNGKSLYLPPSSTLKFNAAGGSYAAIIMSSHSTLSGNGAISSSRYDYNYNQWNTNDRKAAIKIIGEGVKLEIGNICGFEYGFDIGGTYGIVGCNINIRYFINVLYCFVINPYGGGFVNQNYFHWDATSINWDNNPSFRSQSCGIYMEGVGEPNHNTFSGSIENYYIALRLSGAFNRFLGFRGESCDYTVVINDPGTHTTRFNTIFGEYGNINEFYNKILNNQTSKTIQYAIQIYGPEGNNWLNVVWARGYYTFSDSTLKKDIHSINSALSKVLALRGVRYQHKLSITDQEKGDEYNFGFIAQETKEVLPELVHITGADSLYAIDYMGIIPILVEAIKEQEDKIEDLNSRLKNLQEMLEKVIPLTKDPK